MWLAGRHIPARRPAVGRGRQRGPAAVRGLHRGPPARARRRRRARHAPGALPQVGRPHRGYERGNRPEIYAIEHLTKLPASGIEEFQTAKVENKADAKFGSIHVIEWDFINVRRGLTQVIQIISTYDSVSPRSRFLRASIENWRTFYKLTNRNWCLNF